MDTITRQDMIVFCVQLGVMLGMALGCGRIMQHFRQPRVLGELIGGILLGPTLFGALAPGAHAWLFSGTGHPAVLREGVLRIGMLFFMFVAGLEVQLSQARKLGPAIAWTSALGMAVPFVLGYGMVVQFPGLWGTPVQEHGRMLALCIAAAMSISALPIIGRILMDLGLMQQNTGVVVMSAAAVNDLLGWSVFAIVLEASSGEGSGNSTIITLVAGTVVVLLALGPGRWLAGALLRRMEGGPAWPSGFVGTIAVLVFVSAACAESMGLHAIFGPFLVGIAMGQGLRSPARQRAHDIISQFALSVFAPLYFVSVGLRASFTSDFDGLLVLLVLAVACLGKILGGALGAYLGGMNRRESLAVGFGLNARGAMEMILASVALEYGIIDRRIFVALILMALITSMVSGPAMQALLRNAPDSCNQNESH